MILKHFVQGALSNNNYLLIDENSKEAVLIDCTEYNPEVKMELDVYGAKLKYILLTHGHFDHILGVENTQKNIGGEIVAPLADKELINHVDTFLYAYGVENVKVPHIDRYITGNDSLSFGDIQIKVLDLPGHTEGGLGYVVEDKLFSGDTIFKESVGRTDLPGGSFEKLKDSIETKVFTLPEEYAIYPGHGDFTTVKHEKENNRFM